MNKILTEQLNFEVDELIAGQQPQGERLAIKQGFLARLGRDPQGDSAWEWLVWRCSVVKQIPQMTAKFPKVKDIIAPQGGLF